MSTAVCTPVDSHVDCNARQTERLTELEGELEAVKGREAEAKSLLSATAEEREQLKEKVDKIDTEWQAKLLVAEEKLSAVDNELTSLHIRYQELLEEHAQVEEARLALEQSVKGEAVLLSDELGRLYMRRMYVSCCVYLRACTVHVSLYVYVHTIIVVQHCTLPINFKSKSTTMSIIA